MSAVHDPAETVRVASDGSEVQAPPGQAATAVVAEGEQVDAVLRDGEWADAEYGDADFDHPDTRPRLRGWLHLFAAFGSIVAGAVLIPLAWTHGGVRAGLPVSIYCLTILGLFGISAAYHRRRWSPRGWKLMKRLDHSMIFVFIAGTYTPFAALAVPAPTNWVILAVVWGGALGGVALKMAWPPHRAGWVCRSTSRWAGWRSSCSPTSWPWPG